jgi:hypothetical protein
MTDTAIPSISTFTKRNGDYDFLGKQVTQDSVVAYFSDRRPGDHRRGLSVGRLSRINQSTVKVSQPTLTRALNIYSQNTIILPEEFVDGLTDEQIAAKTEHNKKVHTDFAGQPLAEGDIVAFFHKGNTYVDGSDFKLAMVKSFTDMQVRVHRFKANANTRGTFKKQQDSVTVGKRFVAKVMSGEDFAGLPPTWIEKILFKD